MAVALTLVQTKQIRINMHKQNKKTVQTIQNTVNTSTHYQNTHTLQNKLKHPQYKLNTLQDTRQMK